MRCGRPIGRLCSAGLGPPPRSTWTPTTGPAGTRSSSARNTGDSSRRSVPSHHTIVVPTPSGLEGHTVLPVTEYLSGRQLTAVSVLQETTADMLGGVKRSGKQGNISGNHQADLNTFELLP